MIEEKKIKDGLKSDDIHDTNITRLILKIEELKKELSYYRGFFDQIPFMMWAKDLEGKFIFVNQTFAKVFEKPVEEFSGLTDYDFFPREFADKNRADDDEVIRSLQQLSFEEPFQINDGYKWQETMKFPLISACGIISGTTGLARDITEQKQAEKALIRSEEKFKDLATLLPEVIFETDAMGKITFVNLSAFKKFGYTQSDIDAGINIFDLIAPENIEKAKLHFNKTMLGREYKEEEYRVLTREKKEITVLVSTNNLYTEGKWMGIRGVLVDISERKISEKREKDYQNKLLFLNNTALDFLSISSGENIYKYAGIKLKEFIRSGYILISSFDESEHMLKLEYFSGKSKILKLVSEKAGLFTDGISFKLSEKEISVLMQNAEHLHELQDGLHEVSFNKLPKSLARKIEHLLQIRKIYGIALMRGGKLFGSIIIVSQQKEIEDKPLIETFVYQASIALHRRQLEIELISAKVKAEESDKLKTAFLANMSHEIRTPMNGIVGISQLLSQQEYLDSSASREFLSMINANGALLLNLVNNIIDISKIESKQVDLNEVEFPINGLFKELNNIVLSEKMTRNKDKVELKFSKTLEDRDSFIIADKQKILQVLTNLIGNAVKFTQQGLVEFGYDILENQFIRFFVKDNGIGIPGEKIEVIFNRFTQADQSLTRPFSGSGLGLAISKGFVERMGGRIWVKSKLNQGSVFYFTIPYKPVIKYTPSVTEYQRPITSYNWSNMCILVVEDNYISYRLLEVTLSRTGIQIAHAENGLMAIEAVKNRPEINLVLMDIQLPIMNGYEATREIKKIRPELVVIAQTANAMDDDRQKCLNSGCNDYITKPIVLETMLSIINTYIRKT